MDNKNYPKTCSAAMHLAIIKKQWGILAGRLSLSSALGRVYRKKSAGYLIIQGKMLKI
jgi:hypothetical protein